MWLRMCSVLALLVLVLTGCSSDVKIGVVVSETGALGSYGKNARKAIEMAAEEINAAGGVMGGNIVLTFRDDATHADIGKQVVNELIEEEDIDIIIGAMSSTVTLAIGPICESRGCLLLSPAASSPKISLLGTHVFRNYPSDILEGTSMARFAQELGLERVVIFAMSNDYGEGLRDVFTDQYESRFRQVVQVFEFEEADTSGLPEMIGQLGELSPDGIFVVAYQDQQVELLRQLDEAGVTAIKMASSSVTPEMVRHVAEAGENLVYPTTNFDANSTDKAVVAFVDAYRAKYGEDPDIYAAHAYDALYLLKEAVEIGGSSRVDHVVAGLMGIKNYEGAAGRTNFDDNGDVVRYPRLFIIRDGNAMPYDKFVEDGGSLLAEQ